MQIMLFALKLLHLDFENEQNIPIITQEELKKLRDNDRLCRVLIRKFEKTMKEHNIEIDNDLLTNIVEVKDGKYTRGYHI